MTATTGRTALAIVAILSLLVSLFTIARPVIASHDGTPDPAETHELAAGTAVVDGTKDSSYEQVAILSEAGKSPGDPGYTVVGNVYMVYNEDGCEGEGELFVFVEMLGGRTIDTDSQLAFYVDTNGDGTRDEILAFSAGPTFNTGRTAVEFSVCYTCVDAEDGGQLVGLHLNYSDAGGTNQGRTARLPGAGNTTDTVLRIACPDTASKSGTKFHDLNADGEWNAGEAGLSGWTIYVDYNNDQVLNTGEPSAVTGTDGTYLIQDIDPGTWTVREVAQTGWTCSYPNAGTESTPVTSTACAYTGEVFTGGVENTDNDFGNWTTASKTGLKFNDMNGNGTQDEGEPGLAGWTFYVDYNDSSTLDTGEPSGVSIANGTFSITGIVPGTWTVREVGQGGWTCTTPDPCEHEETFDSQDQLTDNVFGNQQQVVEEDVTLLKRDQDGASMSGISFTLTNDDDYDRTQSTVGGSVTFTELTEGEYTLTENNTTCENDGPWTVNVTADGTITITDDDEEVLTVNNDGSFTIVNDCDDGNGDDDGHIAIFKTMCDSIGQQDTCNGRDTSLDGYMIDFEIYAGEGTGGTLVDTATVTLSENAEGQGNTGNGSQGRILSDELTPGTYTVCEITVAYLLDEGGDRIDEVQLDAFPRPEAGNGGSTGGNQEQIDGTDCIVVEVTSGTAEVKFLDLIAGSITILKNAVPDAAQDFAFTTTGTDLSNFSLDDDADATLSNQRTFSGLAAGSYSVTESVTAGWTLTSITCSTGGTIDMANRRANITLAAGQNVTCTFVNTLQSEGTAGGGGGPAATPTPTTSREGTLADTAMESPPVGGPSVLLLALLMLTASLTSAAYVTGMEGRRPR